MYFVLFDLNWVLLHLRAGAFPWESPPHVFGLQAPLLGGSRLPLLPVPSGAPSTPAVLRAGTTQKPRLAYAAFPTLRFVSGDRFRINLRSGSFSRI